mmetsp:Transcript_19258/g.68020  ORF Transcript_19258/g.68020 Transcript_19258/m.68020 type:complete len:209 (-) Transcript_19258:440-1066(-)
MRRVRGVGVGTGWRRAAVGRGGRGGQWRGVGGGAAGAGAGGVRRARRVARRRRRRRGTGTHRQHRCARRRAHLAVPRAAAAALGGRGGAAVHDRVPPGRGACLHGRRARCRAHLQARGCGAARSALREPRRRRRRPCRRRRRRHCAWPRGDGGRRGVASLLAERWRRRPWRPRGGRCRRRALPGCVAAHRAGGALVLPRACWAQPAHS